MRNTKPIIDLVLLIIHSYKSEHIVCLRFIDIVAVEIFGRSILNDNLLPSLYSFHGKDSGYIVKVKSIW